MKHILIIDDDVHIGNMLCEVLISEGYKVSRAYSGTEALLLLSNIKPDLILLDLMLPGLKQQYSNGDRELKEAITNISHDLRTPLTAICGYLDLLEKQELSEDTERYIEQIRNRTEVLKQLTEELFRYSVIASTPALTYEKINLCRILEESLISFEGTMQQADIAPEIQMPNAPVWRVLDASAVARIFGNLINNAIRYSDGDLSVRMDADGKISFINTAKELSTVEVGKLFDRFYTVDSARKTTGLGLSIAKTLVEQMNGSITASYESGKLNITIFFPL